jgi:hypothetical protein
LIVLVLLVLCALLALWLAAPDQSTSALLPSAEPGVPATSTRTVPAEIERTSELPARAGVDVAKEPVPSTRAAPAAEPSPIAWTLRMIDERGAPVDGVSVRLLNDAYAGGSTNRVGEWHRTLRSGTWSLRVSNFGYATVERELQLAPEPREQALEITLESTPLIGVELLTPSGAPLEERHYPRIVASSRELPERLLRLNDGLLYDGAASVQHRNGIVNRKRGPVTSWIQQVGSFPASVQWLLVPHQAPPFHVGAYWGTVAVDRVEVEPGQSIVTLRVDPEVVERLGASFDVRFVEFTSRKPIAGTLTSERGDSWPTDEHGRVVVNGLAPGPTGFDLEGVGGYRYRFELPLEPGTETDLGEIELHAGLRIEGHVELATSDPFPSMLCARSLDRPAPWRPVGRSYGFASVAADGSFSARLPTPGRYYVYPSHESLHDTFAINGEVLTVPSDGLSGVRLHVRPGVRVILVADTDPIEQLAAVVVDEAGNEVLADESSQPRHVYLARGTYRWTLNRGSTIVSSGSFEVGDQPTTVVLHR